MRTVLAITGAAFTPALIIGSVEAIAIVLWLICVEVLVAVVLNWLAK